MRVSECPEPLLQRADAPCRSSESTRHAPLPAKNRASGSCQRITLASDSRDSDRSRMPKGPPRSGIQKKFWQGESMVDEHIIAILPPWDSNIDAMLTRLGQTVAAVQLI